MGRLPQRCLLPEPLCSLRIHQAIVGFLPFRRSHRLVQRIPGVGLPFQDLHSPPNEVDRAGRLKRHCKRLKRSVRQPNPFFGTKGSEESRLLLDHSFSRLSCGLMAKALARKAEVRGALLVHFELQMRTSCASRTELNDSKHVQDGMYEQGRLN